MRLWFHSLSFCMVLGAVAHSTLAHAESVPKSYAEQTLLADGTSIALVVAGIATSDRTANVALSVGGVAGYALATPIIHAAHGKWDSTGVSFWSRFVGVPIGGLLGGLVGVATCPDNGQTGLETLGCSAYGALAGVGVSAALISVLDAAFLARETTHEPSRPSAAPKASFRLTPSVDAVRRSATIGVVGTF
jgi:hypothetical protein